MALLLAIFTSLAGGKYGYLKGFYGCFRRIYLPGGSENNSKTKPI